MPRAWEGRAAFGKSCQLVDEYVRRGAWALPPPTPGCDASRHWPPMQKEPVFGKIWHYVKTGSYALPAADAPPVTAALRARLATALGPAPADGAADGGEALIAELVDWCVRAVGAKQKLGRVAGKMQDASLRLPTRGELVKMLPPRVVGILQKEASGLKRRRLLTWAGFVQKVAERGSVPFESDGMLGRRLNNMIQLETVCMAIRSQAKAIVDAFPMSADLHARLMTVLTRIGRNELVKKRRQRPHPVTCEPTFDEWARAPHSV